jgi:uracil-DNA glycosylase
MNMTNGAKILIVGQNPGNNPKAFKYKNHTIDRLNNWCSELGVMNYSFMNVINTIGECKIEEVDFNTLRFSTRDYTHILALGNFASRCLHLINRSHFKLPHPSPRNRLMNDKEYVQDVLKRCKEYIHE